MSGLHVVAEDNRPSEIVIIRRPMALGVDAPKGGVWKIAFADFMTAMMAFFLVMWLVNAANQDTKQAVASYFNPVKLSDVSAKGLHNTQVVDHPGEVKGKIDNSEQEAKGGAQADGKGAAKSEATPASEEALFRDPYAALAQIAAGQAVGAGPKRGPGGGDKPAGLAGGDAFRDPFDPAFWRSVKPASGAAPSDTPDTEAEAQSAAAPPVNVDAAAPAEATPAAPTPSAIQAAIPAPADTPAILPAVPAPPQNIATPALPMSRPGAPDRTRLGGPVPMTEPDGATELTHQLNAALHNDAAGKAPDIDVQKTPEGVLVSLTDDVDFGMFEVGSAEPNAKVIAIMEKIAGVLKDRPGDIIIRGHTDARPFHSTTYDNWRLSTARAHMAYYMLVRGGLDANRVARIEGYADRNLKVPEDPDSPRNRRIEILIEEKPS